MSEVNVKDLVIKQNVRDVLSRYCRGLDRMDKAMAYAVFHAEAKAHYFDIYEGTGRGFVDWVWEAHAAMDRHSHQINNVLIEVDGETAVSEAYVTVVLWTLPDAQGVQTEIIGRGRYLDRWCFRDGFFAIDYREHVLDMQTVTALSPGYVNKQSARDGSDASVAFFGN